MDKMNIFDIINKHKGKNGYEYIRKFNGEVIGQPFNLLDPAWQANEKMIGLLRARDKCISCNAVLIACNDEKVQQAIKEFHENNPAILEALKEWGYFSDCGMMKKDILYKDWMKKFERDHSPLGDLARDIGLDEKFPKSNDMPRLLNYLKRTAYDEAINVFVKSYALFSLTV